MRDVTLYGIQRRCCFPSGSEIIQHATRVVGESRHGVRGLPQVDKGRLKQKQTIQFLGVNGGNTCHLSQRPIGGIPDVVVGVVREVVHVDGHLHTTTIHPVCQCRGLRLIPRLNFLFEPTFKDGQILPFVDVCYHIEVTFDLCDVMLSSTMVKTAQNMVLHQHHRAHSLTVVQNAERLKSRNHTFLAIAILGGDAHSDCGGVDEKTRQLKFKHIVPPSNGFVGHGEVQRHGFGICRSGGCEICQRHGHESRMCHVIRSRFSAHGFDAPLFQFEQVNPCVRILRPSAKSE